MLITYLNLSMILAASISWSGKKYNMILSWQCHMSFARDWNMMIVNRTQHVLTFDISLCSFVFLSRTSAALFDLHTNTTLRHYKWMPLLFWHREIEVGVIWLALSANFLRAGGLWLTTGSSIDVICEIWVRTYYYKSPVKASDTVVTCNRRSFLVRSC